MQPWELRVVGWKATLPLDLHYYMHAWAFTGWRARESTVNKNRTWLTKQLYYHNYFMCTISFIAQQAESRELNAKSEGTISRIKFLYQRLCTILFIHYSGFPLLGPRESDRESSWVWNTVINVALQLMQYQVHRVWYMHWIVFIAPQG